MRVCLLGVPRSGTQYISRVIARSYKIRTNLVEPFTDNSQSWLSKEKNLIRAEVVDPETLNFKSYKDRIDQVLEILKSGNVKQPLIMKLFLVEETQPYLKEIIEALKALEFTFFIIKRENTEHHLLSHAIAVESGKWNSHEGTHSPNDKYTVTSLGIASMQWSHRQLTKFDNLIKELNIECDTIRYEHAITDLKRLLDVPIDANITLSKQIIGDPYNMIENAAEVRTFIKQTVPVKYIKLEHATPEHENWFVVNWCLGNTCNFECSYCPAALHDGSKKWPDLQSIKNFIARVKDHYFHKNIYFEFTGGEVTMYRHFTEICQFCNEMGIKVGLISNGSRTLRYWEENKQFFDHVCLSYHPEFADEKHFIEVVKLLNNDVRTHVNIMMSPEKFDHCYAVANKVKNLGNISMALQPLIHDFGDTLYDYNDFQKKIFEKQHELVSKHIKFTKKFDYYRGAMRTVYDDGATQVSSAHRFISENSNNWSGWNCYAGVEQLIVDMDGTIHRGWCKVGGEIGHIEDVDLNLPTEPVLCNKTMCHCNFDIMCTKEKY